MGHLCCSKQKVRRGLWSPEEDEKLLNYITCHGHASWSSLPKLAGLQRCGKSCRLRWINYLRPEVKRGSFSAEEEQIIIDVHRMLGNRWSEIAKHLAGRTDNEVKNYWNSCIKKKLLAQGLDPKTHTLLKTTSRNHPLLRLEKKPKLLKLHKNSHISYTPTTNDLNTTQPIRSPPLQPHKSSRACITTKHQSRANNEADFNRVEACSKSPKLATEDEIPESLLQEDRSSCVGIGGGREDCLGGFGFELGSIDDMSTMDDLLWNSGFAT